MDEKILGETKLLLQRVADKFLVENVDTGNSIAEIFEDIRSLHDEVDELRGYLHQLSSSLDVNNKQACVEAIVMAKAMYMNVENAYSNLADLMSDIAVTVRDEA